MRVRSTYPTRAQRNSGIATLRYDDRGFAASTGDVENVTTEGLKEDAAAVLSLLRRRFDRVGVVGHSEGGTIALMLAAEGQADFIVSLAGMIVPGKETLLAQNRRALNEAGLDQHTVGAYCKALGDSFDAAVEGRALPSPSGFDIPAPLQQNLAAVQAQLRMPYLRYFVGLDISQRLGAVTCPVLALNGTLDTQVDCVANLGLLKDCFPDSQQVRIIPVEGVNHLFQHCTTGNAAEYPRIEETVAPEVLALIADFLLQR